MRGGMAVLAMLVVLGVGSPSRAEPYPEPLRAAFMERCGVEADPAHCVCVLERLEEGVPVEKLGDSSFDAETSAAIDGYASACLSEVEPEGPWPNAVREAFLSGCQQGASAGECGCVLAELERRVPFRALAAGSTAMSEEVAAIVRGCQQSASP